jgi:hypothetical protein
MDTALPQGARLSSVSSEIMATREFPTPLSEGSRGPRGVAFPLGPVRTPGFCGVRAVDKPDPHLDTHRRRRERHPMPIMRPAKIKTIVEQPYTVR